MPARVRELAMLVLAGTLSVLLAVCFASAGYLDYADMLDSVLVHARRGSPPHAPGNATLGQRTRNGIGEVYGMGLYAVAMIVMEFVRLVVRLAPAVALTVGVVCVSFAISEALD